MEYLTVAAIVLGPIFAVIITRFIDSRRMARHRRLEIFRNLMASRSQPLSRDFVGALNLIEIEFHGKKYVIESWRNLMDHFNSQISSQEDQQKLWIEQTGKKQALLLDSIGQDLGIKIQQLDIYQGGYTPRAWGEGELRQQFIQNLLADVLSGKRGFPIELFQQQQDVQPNASEPDQTDEQKES